MTQDQPGDAAAALGAHSKDAMGGATRPGAAPNYYNTVDMAQDMAGDLAEKVRARPITALLAAAAVGWLVGRIGRYI